ncbi:hypothetical protein BsWGS_23592 [Bradybaena similaris]
MSESLVAAQELKTQCAEIEVPEDHYEDDDDDDRRLWIGNLGSEITEYSILKLVQKFGSLRRINFIYHKVGPDKGKPKGYCFVSFHTWEAAEKARKALDGRVILSRRLFVKWANKLKKDDVLLKKSKLKSPSEVTPDTAPPPAVVAALSASSAVAAASSEAKIKAIEAKLKMMEQTQKDFSLSTGIQAPASLIVSTSRPSRQSGRLNPYTKSHRPTV